MREREGERERRGLALAQQHGHPAACRDMVVLPCPIAEDWT